MRTNAGFVLTVPIRARPVVSSVRRFPGRIGSSPAPINSIPMEPGGRSGCAMGGMAARRSITTWISTLQASGDPARMSLIATGMYGLMEHERPGMEP